MKMKRVKIRVLLLAVAIALNFLFIPAPMKASAAVDRARIVNGQFNFTPNEFCELFEKRATEWLKGQSYYNNTIALHMSVDEEGVGTLSVDDSVAAIILFFPGEQDDWTKEEPMLPDESGVRKIVTAVSKNNSDFHLLLEYLMAYTCDPTDDFSRSDAMDLILTLMKSGRDNGYLNFETSLHGLSYKELNTNEYCCLEVSVEEPNAEQADAAQPGAVPEEAAGPESTGTEGDAQGTHTEDETDSTHPFNAGTSSAVEQEDEKDKSASEGQDSLTEGSTEGTEVIEETAAGEIKDAEEGWKQLFYGFYADYSTTESKTVLDNNGYASERWEYHVDYYGNKTFEVERIAYDESGEEISSETFDAATEELISYSEKKRDASGRVYEESEYLADGTLLTRYTRRYHGSSETLRYMEREDYDSNENLTGRNTYEYDSDGHLIRYEYYNSYGELRRVETTEYNSQGKEVKGHLVAEDIEKSVSYQYDADGLLVRKVETTLPGDSKKSETITDYTYDDNGNKLEIIVTTDGVETYRSVYGWGYWKSGRITAYSGQQDYAEFDPDSYIASASKGTARSSGKVSFERTRLLTYNGVTAFATAYAIDTDVESIQFYVENSGNDSAAVQLDYLEVNGRRLSANLWMRADAKSNKSGAVFIYPGLLETAGIEKIETIKLSMHVVKDNSTVYQGEEITIPVQDERTRVTALQTMDETIYDAGAVCIRFLGCEVQDKAVSVYYSVENRGSDDVTLKVEGATINGQKGTCILFDSVESGTTVTGRISISNSSYGKLDPVRTVEFPMILQGPSWRTVAAAESMRLEFDEEGNLESFAGKLEATEKADSSGTSSDADNGKTVTYQDANGEVITEVYDDAGNLIHKEEPYYENGKKAGTLCYDAEIRCRVSMWDTYVTPSSWRLPVIYPSKSLDKCLSFTLNMTYTMLEDPKALGTQVVYYRVNDSFSSAGYLEMKNLNEEYSMDIRFDTPKKVDGFATMSYHPSKSGSFKLECRLTDVYYLK